jgi:AcrR family transcriptional regulator
VVEHRTAPFRAQLEAVLETVVAVGLPRARFRLLLMQFDPAQQVARKRAFRKMLSAVLKAPFARARRRGELNPDPDELQVTVLFGLVHAAFMANQADPKLMPPQRIARFVTGAFLDGAAPRGATR